MPSDADRLQERLIAALSAAGVVTEVTVVSLEGAVLNGEPFPYPVLLIAWAGDTLSESQQLHVPRLLGQTLIHACEELDINSETGFRLSPTLTYDLEKMKDLTPPKMDVIDRAIEELITGSAV